MRTKNKNNITFSKNKKITVQDLLRIKLRNKDNKSAII